MGTLKLNAIQTHFSGSECFSSGKYIDSSHRERMYMSSYSWGHNPYINRNPKVVFLQIDFSESDIFDFDSNIVRR